MFDYKNYVQEFKSKANKHELTAKDMAELAIHKAIKAKNNDKLAVAKNLLYSSFTAISNKNKLLNGAKPLEKLTEALIQLKVYVSYADHVKETWGDEYRKSFLDLLKQVQDSELEDITYAYMFVKQDMSREQQMVQCGHVSMVLGQKVPSTKYDAHQLHFIVFGVPDEVSLHRKMAFLTYKKVKYVQFVEPDMGNAITAIACLPMKKSYAMRKRLFDEDTLLVMQ